MRQLSIRVTEAGSNEIGEELQPRKVPHWSNSCVIEPSFVEKVTVLLLGVLVCKIMNEYGKTIIN